MSREVKSIIEKPIKSSIRKQENNVNKLLRRQDAKWLKEGSDDFRGFVQNDDLKELFYDPTKNKLDQIEQLMTVLGIKYDKGVYDVFTTVFKYAHMLFLFGMAIFYLILICYVVFIMVVQNDYITGPKLAGLLAIHIFITFYLTFT